MKHLPDHKKGLIAVFAAAILWSTGGLFIKLITLDAMELSFFRCVFAAIVFAVIFRKDVLYANGFALINAAFYAAVLILFVMATKNTTAANAIFLQYTAPIYIFIFEPLINKTHFEKINLYTIIICFAGMILFFLGELSPGHLEGNIFALLSGIAFAAFMIGMRKNKAEYQFSSIFYGNILVALICIPFILDIQIITFSDLWMVAFLGVFQIGIAYAIFSYGLKKVYAIEASLIGMIEPVLNPVWVFFGYGEVPSLTAIIGGLIIVATISVRAFILDSAVMKAVLKLKSK
ncbi:MAG: EamA/RhaT family transporter [Ignavibacteriales bacterium]|nr:MAG: EamA/RhaT family transporter [Ignavibacteriales bacterium]